MQNPDMWGNTNMGEYDNVGETTLTRTNVQLCCEAMLPTCYLKVLLRNTRVQPTTPR